LHGSGSFSAAARAGVRIRIEGVRRVFPDGLVAIDGLHLDIPAGQFAAILGPSGCGKSTLLRLVAGLDRPDGGTLHLEADTAGERLSIAYVFQDAHLLPWRSVLANVALPLEFAGMPAGPRETAARAVLEQVGLSDAIGSFPGELSGGMRMRVSLARALVTQPRLLLLDEPFAALDELTRFRLDDELRRLWMDRAMTILFVTHSITEAAYLADRAVVLSPCPARVAADLQIQLPRERAAAVRHVPEFSREVKRLLQALHVAAT
jgi:NitT/TauT family transport system ATP-binding protein